MSDFNLATEEAIAGMVSGRVAGAAIIDVFITALFLDDLAGNWATAVAAGNQNERRAGTRSALYGRYDPAALRKPVEGLVVLQ